MLSEPESQLKIRTPIPKRFILITDFYFTCACSVSQQPNYAKATPVIQKADPPFGAGLLPPPEIGWVLHLESATCRCVLGPGEL